MVRWSLIPKETRSLFRDDPGQPSARSDADSPTVEELIGFVKTNDPKRRPAMAANSTFFRHHLWSTD